ncbi:hypothetical protein [Amycolatopsis circi]|uniref:hypothetical protein n=1 Tax=Amycolatopsis circi TaxID=871959 RepID=UPI000E26638A|nr:hypothetical protein [Amycolatopsis circi]
MTATNAKGFEVIADEPTEAPMRAKGGAPVLWRQTRTLLLADGSTTYGCLHCDYTSDNMHSIRPHLNKHRTTPAVEVEVDPLDGLTLGEIRQQLAAADDWKARALRAEQHLSMLRSALREVTA